MFSAVTKSTSFFDFSFFLIGGDSGPIVGVEPGWPLGSSFRKKPPKGITAPFWEHPNLVLFLATLEPIPLVFTVNFFAPFFGNLLDFGFFETRDIIDR